MRTILEIYFAINLFMSGFIFSNDYTWAKDRKEKVYAIFHAAAIVLFGALGFTLKWFLLGLWAIYCMIDKGMWLVFHFEWYFTKKYARLNDEQLSNMNLMASKHNSTSKSDKRWQKWIGKINERNNYTYKPELDN